MLDKKLPVYVKQLPDSTWLCRYPASHHVRWQAWRPIPKGLTIMEYKRMREASGVYAVVYDPEVVVRL